MSHSQNGAEQKGVAKTYFIARIREAYAEYRDHGLGASAAMAEVGMALHDLDRKGTK